MDKIKILYVEDEPFLSRIVKESLESRGFLVELVSDGAFALTSFVNFQPHICVLDVMLPHKDGFSIAREIREQNPGMPIIFLTAKSQTEDLVKGFESGGNDYLRKPFSMEELIIRINNLIRIVSNHPFQQKEKQQPEKVKLGRYIFYPSLFELHFEHHIRKLSHRENNLLQMLISNGEQPVMRKDILLNLWGDDSWNNSRNLDVYISRIRDYFSADPSVRITTIKCVGYQFSTREDSN
jgi:DNA-binding response OmpR family regulator